MSKIKSCKLNKKQRIYIAEMCKIFFPNFEDIDIVTNDGDGCVKIIGTHYVGGSEFRQFIYPLVEFCWILVNKIAEKQKLSPLQMLNFITKFGQVCFNRFPDGHPVDFLYEQFKRKKNNLTKKL